MILSTREMDEDNMKYFKTFGKCLLESYDTEKPITENEQRRVAGDLNFFIKTEYLYDTCTVWIEFNELIRVLLKGTSKKRNLLNSNVRMWKKSDRSINGKMRGYIVNSHDNITYKYELSINDLDEYVKKLIEIMSIE